MRSSTIYMLCLMIVLGAVGYVKLMGDFSQLEAEKLLHEAESATGNDVEHPARMLVPKRKSLGFFIVTAYCKGECCCGEYADGITASGWKINKGDLFCAADKMIPFLKVLDIEGYGAVPVLDRGGAIKGNKIDVFFWTHEEALEWGVQEIEIFCWVKGE